MVLEPPCCDDRDHEQEQQQQQQSHCLRVCGRFLLSLLSSLALSPLKVALGPAAVGDDVKPADMRAFAVPAGKGPPSLRPAFACPMNQTKCHSVAAGCWLPRLLLLPNSGARCFGVWCWNLFAAPESGRRRMHDCRAAHFCWSIGAGIRLPQACTSTRGPGTMACTCTRTTAPRGS